MELEEYLGVRNRLDAIARVSDGGTPVPACPGWRVRDVLAHLAGLCEDWVDHRLDGYASESWTAAQVSRFEACTVEEVLERWATATSRFAELEDDPVMGPPGRWAFGDAVTHEADIRGALGVGRVPSEVVRVALSGSITRWRQTLGAAGAPPLLLRVPDARDWRLGEHEGPSGVTVEAPAYDVFRALAGRRTTDQVRAWTWTNDPGRYLRAGLPYPFQWARAPIDD